MSGVRFLNGLIASPVEEGAIGGCGEDESRALDRHRELETDMELSMSPLGCGEECMSEGDRPGVLDTTAPLSEALGYLTCIEGL